MKIYRILLLFIWLNNISSSNAFIPDLTNNIEDIFAEEFIVDITSQEYIDKHTNAKSRKIIQSYKERCILLQQKGNFYALLNEIDHLQTRVNKKINKNKHIDNICLAIAEKIYLAPITIILDIIAHDPLEQACDQLKDLRVQIIQKALENNIYDNIKIKEWLIEEYGFEVREAARNCYISRDDHIDITQYQFPEDLKHILSIIQNKHLPIAHAELTHLKKQLIEYLERHNITDSLEQKNFIIKNFNCDIIELAYNIYRGRIDHKTLISYFTPPVNLQATIMMTLNNQEYDHISRGHEFDKLTNDIFHQAELCGLNILPKTKSRITEALNIIKKPCNDAELISCVMLIHDILNNIQDKVYSIIDDKLVLSRQSSELFTQAMEKCIARFN